MFLIFVNVIFVLSAIAMVVLILLQRGSADAGAGFGGGGGASATVFGARGSANFLSKATKWLAVVFFTISLGLAIYASKPHTAATATTDLGVMAQTVPPPTSAPATSSAPSAMKLPTTSQAPVPAVPAPVSGPASTAPSTQTPAVPAPQPMIPASNQTDAAKHDNKGS